MHNMASVPRAKQCIQEPNNTNLDQHLSGPVDYLQGRKGRAGDYLHPETMKVPVGDLRVDLV